MRVERIYKGLTRPPSLFGVPMQMVLLMIMAWALIGYWAYYFFRPKYFLLVFMAIPNFLYFKYLISKDEMAFRLYNLQVKFYKSSLNAKFFNGIKTYISNSTYSAFSNRTNMPKLSVVALNKYPNLQELIPFQTLINNVVITKNNDYIATWRVDGIPFEVEDDELKEIDRNRINMLVRQFSSDNVSFYFHNCRMAIETRLESKFNNPFLDEMSKKYYEIFTNENLKENKLYVSVIYSPVSAIARNKAFKAMNITKKKKAINTHLKEFERICNVVNQNLQAFHPQRLGVYELNGVKYSNQLEFYNYLLGGRMSQNLRVRVPNAPLDFVLNGNLNEIHASAHTLQLNYNDGKKRFVRAIEIKEYPNESFIGIFDALMYAGVEYTITQSFTPLSRQEARKALENQQKRLIASQDTGISQIEDLDDALDKLNDDLIFGNYHFSLVIYGNTQERLERTANALAVVLQELGFLTTQANIALEATYFAQLPANFTIRPRLHDISSKNYADFIALHNFPRGKKIGNPWGEAITILQTPNGQPYFFNIHQTIFNKDEFGKNDILANTFVLGRSGGGKTVLMNFTLNMLCKYNNPNSFHETTPVDKRKATYFYLDKDKGALGNIMAIGGKYIIIKSGKETGFNPLYCVASAENVRRVKVLMKMLVTKGERSLSTKQEEALNFAVDSVMALPKEDRQHGITLISQMIQEDDSDNSLKARLKAWTNGNEFGWVFDNETDTLDFSDENIFVYGIDGTDLLKDDEISPFVAYYILWRIIDMVDGCRFGLFIDEAWDWLKNSVVSKEVFNKEKTIRKENGFLFLGTQSVEDLANSPIGTAIIEQSETILLLSNPKARESDYCDKLKMTKEEYEFVKTALPEKYEFLIKKGDYRAIAKINLAHLGNMVKVFSTSKDNVDSLEEINEMDINRAEKYEKIREYYRIEA